MEKISHSDGNLMMIKAFSA